MKVNDEDIMKQAKESIQYNPYNRIAKWIKRILLAVFVLFVILFILNLSIEGGGSWKPDYQKIELGSIINKAELSEQDYYTILIQTGLGRDAADKLLNKLPKKDRRQEFEKHQNNFFSSGEYECRSIACVVREEKVRDEAGNLVKGFEITDLRDGDILLTKATHTLGWRHGHAAIVIDAAKGETLEAIVLGTPSVIQEVSKWQAYPSFIQLRLKADKQDKAEMIARYARENVLGIPYGLLAGIPEKAPEKLKKTQCSHLVWYPYAHFGYDIDSDGSWLVTPKDIAYSEHLEIVQVYGVNPEEIAIASVP